MKLILISDMHERHREIEVPMADILVCAGDFTIFDQSLAAIEDFNDWLGELPHPFKVVVYGNHSFLFERHPQLRSLLFNSTVLLDQRLDLLGMRFWGSPVTPLLGGAFGMISSANRARHWAQIPEDTQILITHGPPWGILDRSPGQLEHIGDPELLEALRRLKDLRLHVFGHVHGATGLVSRHGITFANSSSIDHEGQIRTSPLTIELF